MVQLDARQPLDDIVTHRLTGSILHASPVRDPASRSRCTEGRAGLRRHERPCPSPIPTLPLPGRGGANTEGGPPAQEPAILHLSPSATRQSMKWLPPGHPDSIV